MYSKSYTVHKQFVACFLDRNISMFTSLGNNLAWCGCSMYPPELNTRSNGTLVPQIHRYFPTSTESSGNLLLFCFYQSKGLLLTRYDLFLRLLIGSSTGFLLGTFSRIAASPIACLGGEEFLLHLHEWEAFSCQPQQQLLMLTPQEYLLYSALNLGSKKEHWSKAQQCHCYYYYYY